MLQWLRKRRCRLSGFCQSASITGLSAGGRNHAAAGKAVVPKTQIVKANAKNFTAVVITAIRSKGAVML